MYKYVLNSVVKISMIFAKYFEYYTIILRGSFFVDTLYLPYKMFDITHDLNYCASILSRRVSSLM